MFGLMENCWQLWHASSLLTMLLLLVCPHCPLGTKMSRKYPNNEEDAAKKEVFPKLYSGDAVVPFSAINTVKRHKRSALQDNIDHSDYVVSFDLDQNTHLSLHVRPLHALLAPRARIEWFGANQTASRFIQKRCLFLGQQLSSSKTSPESVISLCGGLSGLLNTKKQIIYIEPDKTNSPFGRHLARVHEVKNKVPLNVSEDQLDHKDKDYKRPTALAADPPHRQRLARAAVTRQERYIELLLVIDKTVINFHGKELIEQYLLTNINIVNGVYHHPSLGIELNVVVVDIIVIENDVSEEMVDEHGDGKKTLEKFCRWANEQRPRVQYDVAVFLTRTDIGPAGYAPVTGMCNPHRSCAVVRDDGISSAFVIAHEIGHVFGMQHDGVNNNCDKNATDGKIMATMVQSTYDRYYWTNCSRAVIEQVIPEIGCLDNVPGETAWPQYQQPYGQSWSLDEQCQQEFGKGYKLCSAFHDLDPCQYLWCTLGAQEEGQRDDEALCKTKRGSPLPGTTCGDEKWCINGLCVYESGSAAVDGGWSNWGPWAKCSRPCDVGAQIRFRTCSNPLPQHGGKLCAGGNADFKLCNKDACKHEADFRAEQCKLQNDKNFVRDRRHRWRPIENKDFLKLCKLTCISEDTRDVNVTKTDVIDGTFCSYEVPNNICVLGKCQNIGCDGVIDSRAQEDHCGVCRGDGASCREIRGRRNLSLSAAEYHRLLVLPRHARDIEVRERSHTPHLAHFIAVRDLSEDKFILNPDAQKDHSRQFVIHGARFVYIDTGAGESLSARGPLINPVEILIFSHSEKLPAQMEYRYTVPLAADSGEQLEATPAEDEGRYVWQNRGWAKCSATCGEGYQLMEHYCIDKKKMAITEGLCSAYSRPKKVRRPCNRTPCTKDTNPFSWKTGTWQTCSTTCGIHGIQYRDLTCTTAHYGRETQMDPRYCNRDPTPEVNRPCKRIPCPATWTHKAWSKCTVSCGTGMQQRTVDCDKPRDGDRYACDYAARPPDMRLCERSTCPGQTDVSPTSVDFDSMNSVNSSAAADDAENVTVGETPADNPTTYLDSTTSTSLDHSLSDYTHPPSNSHSSSSSKPLPAPPSPTTPSAFLTPSRYSADLNDSRFEVGAEKNHHTPNPSEERDQLRSPHTVPDTTWDTTESTTRESTTPPRRHQDDYTNHGAPPPGRGRKNQLSNTKGRRRRRKNRKRSKYHHHLSQQQQRKSENENVADKILTRSPTVAGPDIVGPDVPTATTMDFATTFTPINPTTRADDNGPRLSEPGADEQWSTTPPPLLPLPGPDLEGLCFTDKSAFCHMKLSRANCAVKHFWDMCCHSCKQYHIGPDP